MFYYYGRKKKVGALYPKARFEAIIEPFAGSAAYSLRPENISKEVILLDKDPMVCEIWDWIIGSAKKADILGMPDLTPGEVTSNPLHILHSASKRAFDYKKITVTRVLATNWNSNKPKMAELVHQVKHWKILQADYSEAPDMTATWFIDPPYSGEAGTGYRHGSSEINYRSLSEWVLKRRGQVIVCEGGDADWLPFKPLTEAIGVAGKRNTELVYTK